MKHLKMIDTQEKEQVYRLSKEYLSPYVGLTTENNNVTYSRPNSYITVTIADGHEMKLNVPQITGETKEVTLGGGGSHKLDMISDYPAAWEILEGKEYLTAINFDEFTTCGYEVINGVHMYPNETLTAICQYCTSLTSVHIPKTLEVIPPNMFLFCTSLSSVTIDEGVKDMQPCCFCNCSNLKNINLPDTLERLDGLSELSELASITIPAKVNYIDISTFDDCPKLKTVTFKSKTQIYTDVVYLNAADTTPLETLYVQPNLLEAYKTHDDWKEIADKIKPIEE